MFFNGNFIFKEVLLQVLFSGKYWSTYYLVDIGSVHRSRILYRKGVVFLWDGREPNENSIETIEAGVVCNSFN